MRPKWPLVPLRYLVNLNRETLPETTPADYSFEYIDISSVSRDEGVRRTDRQVFAQAPSRARRVVRHGDVIISTVRTYLRAATQIDARHDGCVCSTGFAVLSPKPETMDTRFLGYAVTSRRFVDEVVAWSVGVSYPAINAGDLVRLRIPCPPLNEQRRIVADLDAEMARLRKLDNRTRDFDVVASALEQAQIDELLANRRMSRLGWEAEVQTGLTLGKDFGSVPGAVSLPYLRVANVQADHISTADVATTVVSPEIAARTLLKPGDVLMTEGGDIDKLGRGAVWDGSIDPCLHQNHVFAVRCGARLDPRLLALWTRSSIARTYFESTASRITNIASTNVTKLKALPVPVLEPEEQQQVLAELSSDGKRLAGMRSALLRLGQCATAYRDAIVDEALAGGGPVPSHSGPAIDLEAVA